MSRLYWSNREPRAIGSSSLVLEINNSSSRLIVRSKRASALYTWSWLLSQLAYYAVAIAIFLSPPYQAAAPWKNPELVRVIVLAFLLGGFVHLLWISWWVPRFSINNPKRVDNVSVKEAHLGRLTHRLNVRNGEESFDLTVRCPPWRLKRGLEELGIVVE